MERGEAGAGFDGQLVERKVTRSERECAGQHCFPLSRRLAGQRVDEVEIDPPEMALGDVERGKALGRRMGAAEEAQSGVVQRLESEADPVDAGTGEIGEASRF